MGKCRVRVFVRVCKFFCFFFPFSPFSVSLTLGSGAWLIDMLLGPQCAIETLLCFTLIHKIVVNGETATQTTVNITPTLKLLMSLSHYSSGSRWSYDSRG